MPLANEIKRRGCAVIKGHFPREQAMAWDRAMLSIILISIILMMSARPLTTVFGSLEASRPEIYPFTGRKHRCRRGRAKTWLLCIFQKPTVDV